MKDEGNSRVKYVVSDKPIMRNPLCDQTFDTQSSPVREIEIEPHNDVQVQPRVNKRKKGYYVESKGLIYNFLKNEYLKHRGISVEIVGLNINPKMSPEDIKNYKDEEVNTRAERLTTFWQQFFVNFKGKKQVKTKENKEKLKFIKRLRNHLKVDILFTLKEDIREEIDRMERGDAQRKIKAEEMKHYRELEEEKAIFRKVLNMYYSFEKETAEDKKYIERLVWTYREVEGCFPVTADELYQWWLEYPKKEEFTIDNSEAYTRNLVYKFYSQEAKLNRLKQLYKQVNKYSPKKPQILIRYWKEIEVRVL